MVARISTSISLKKALNYNEQKVKKGDAQCIWENCFLLPLKTLNLYDKLELFEDRNRLNDRATTKTLHVSLNFSPEERLTMPDYVAIATDYMKGIGFEEQPWLLYHHTDAGHPHVHILSTTIRNDGTRINTHNLGKTKSETTRKWIEDKYGLVKASRHRQNLREPVQNNGIAKVFYGKAQIKKEVDNILRRVLDAYNLSSLPHLNAVLKQFNLYANPGTENSFIRGKAGLLYQAIDSNGEPVGVPIKASRIAGKPTLKKLESIFKKTAVIRTGLIETLKLKIDDAIQKSPTSLKGLETLLAGHDIVVLHRTNADGRIYGITFVDNDLKLVCNGSEIGKAYSVGGLQKQLAENAPTNKNVGADNQQQKTQMAGDRWIEFNGVLPLDALVRPEHEFNPASTGLRKKKKRKKSR